MKKTVSLLISAVLFMLVGNLAIAACDTCPSGEMVINPNGSHYPAPVMLTSPATFSIRSVDSNIGLFPHILLVMTRNSIIGLTAPITVNWTSGSITISKASFTATNSGYIPPTLITSYDSGRYAVSNLKERLGVNGTSDDILYYALAPFLFGTKYGARVNQTEQLFTVTVSASEPRVLVLAVARTPCSTSFNMRVKPCTPGFIVPEPAPILLVTASIIALGLFSTRRKNE